MSNKVILTKNSLTLLYNLLLIIIIENNMSRCENVTFSTFNNRCDQLKVCLINQGISPNHIVSRIDNSSEYNLLNYQWNTIHGLITPLAYLLPENEHEIQIAIQCCCTLQIRVVPRSGGHSFTKYGYGDSNSLVIDLSKLNKASIDHVSKTCEVGSGARLGQIMYEAWKDGNNYLIPLGMHPAVGVSGLTLGGGYGQFSRLYGMSCDNVLEMKLIDANGQLRLVNDQVNSDLYWALRGSGGGSYGIVTSFKFRLHSAPNCIIYAKVTYNFDSAFEEFFKTWQSWINNPNISDSLNSFIRIRSGNPNIIRLEIYDIITSTNENQQDCSCNSSTTKSRLNNMEKLLSAFPTPISNTTTLKAMSYEEFLVQIIGHGGGYPNVSHPSDLANATKYDFISYTKLKSFYVNKTLESFEIPTLHTLLSNFVYNNSGNSLFIEPFGGAINNLRPSETSFVHRHKNILYNMVLLSVHTDKDFDNHRSGTGNQTKDLEQSLLALKEFYKKSQLLFIHTESYVNYPDEDEPEYLKRYYGDNLARLVKIKELMDPNNFFHHPQSIPVTLQEN